MLSLNDVMYVLVFASTYIAYCSVLCVIQLRSNIYMILVVFGVVIHSIFVVRALWVCSATQRWVGAA